jgi:hypothetical protein
MKLQLASLSAAVLLAAGCGNTGKAAPQNTSPSATSHAKNFPIAPGDTHGPAVGQVAADCNGCHYDKAAAAPSASFRIYTCTSCHAPLRTGVFHDDETALRTQHAAVANFDSTVAAANVLGVAQIDAACRSCHPSGIAVDHLKVFVLPHQDSAATIVAKCADCHINPADRTQLGCASCHPHDLPATTTGHSLVPDFVPIGQAGPNGETASALCARCHEDGKLPVAVSAHAAGAAGFVVGTGLHAGAAGGACLTCHPQNRTTAPRTFVADFSVTTCVACHVTVGGSVSAFHDDATSLGTLHGSVVAFTNTVSSLGLSAACLSCHADGAGGAPGNHEQLFPRGAGTKHAGIGCTQCHGTGAKTDLAALTCFSCHQSDATFTTAHAAPLDHTSTGQDRFTLLDMTSPPVCLRCHAPSSINPASPILPITVAAHSTGESSLNSGKHKNVGCVDCHNTSITVGASYPTQDFTTRSCLICHSSNNPG